MDLTRAYREFEEGHERQRNRRSRPTVLVVGYTGSGKTSLIQAICGKNVVPDDRIGAGLPKTQAFDLYEDDLIRFFDSKGLEPGTSESAFMDEVKRFMRTLQDDPNVDNHIHLVWYAIQGPGARVTPCDLRLIKWIFPNAILLITKNDITRPSQREAIICALAENGVLCSQILPCSEGDKDSLRALVNLSFELLPDAYRDAFVAAQIIDIEKKRSKGRAFVVAAACRSASAIREQGISNEFIRIVFAMLADLAVLYNQPPPVFRHAFLPFIEEALAKLKEDNQKAWFTRTKAKNAYAWTEAFGYVADGYLCKLYEERLAGETPPEISFDPRAFRDEYAARRDA